MTHRPGLLETLARAGLGIGAIGGLSLLGGAVLATLFGQPGEDHAPNRSAAVEGIAPEAATGISGTGPSGTGPVYARDFMMVAAHPAAAHVGAAVLDDGGSAVDALIAAQMVLNLVEPQSSGIGGGGFLLTWDAETGTLHSYDGRETAPAAGTGGYVRNDQGDFKGFMDAVTGGASVGVPGLLRMLEMAHLDHGKRKWADLFGPAIDLAESGFPISPRLHGLLQSAPFLNAMDPAASYFYDVQTGAPHPIGHILTNPEFATSLRLIAEGGADAFHTGPLAVAMVDAVRNASRNPGMLSLEDLAGYEARKRDNLCLHYRIFRVCGMAPPSSGGSTVLQILGHLEYAPGDIVSAGPNSADGVQLFAEAMRLAFADRGKYLADPDFVDVPLEEMLAVSYLGRRAASMDLGDGDKVPLPPGNPTDDRAFLPWGLDNSPELPSTTHLVAVDRRGNIATMTTSIETGFGSRIMVGGFLLNNQLTDFAWSDMRDGELVANRYEPLKRPRSSMAPTLVFGPDGAPRLAIGSPGGSRIIGYVAKTVVGVLDWELSVQEAIDLPHVLNRNGAMELEDRPELDDLADRLAARGYDVKRRAMASGLHGIELAGGLLIGAADPRREGLAVGEVNLTRDMESVFKALIGGR